MSPRRRFFAENAAPLSIMLFSFGVLMTMAIFRLGHLGFIPGTQTLVPVRIDHNVVKQLPGDPAVTQTTTATVTQRVIEEHTTRVVAPPTTIRVHDTVTATAKPSVPVVAEVPTASSTAAVQDPTPTPNSGQSSSASAESSASSETVAPTSDVDDVPSASSAAGAN